MQNLKPKISERQLKLAVEDYLQYGMNQEKWYFDRLNSGSLLTQRGQNTYRVNLCREGTGDFMVIRKWWPQGAPNKWETRVLFLELKGEKGKTSPAQNAFKILVESQGASYVVIRSIDGLEKALSL